MDWISPLTEDEKLRRRRAAGETVADGEYIGFDIAFRDGAPSRGVFLMDDEAAAVAIDVTRQKMIHDQKFALLGDQAPRFDTDSAILIARARVTNGAAAAVRDAARELSGSGAQAVADARAGMISDLHHAGRDGGAAVRDLARAAQYRG